MGPLDLGVIGAPGCFVLTNITGILAATVNDAGEARVPFAIAPNPALAGRVVFQQFLVFDPAANALGISVSQGGAIGIGEF